MASEAVKIGVLPSKVSKETPKPGDHDLADDSGPSGGKQEKEAAVKLDDSEDDHADLSELFDIEIFGRLDLSDTSRFIVKRYTRDCAGVKACIADNNLNPMRFPDVFHANLIVNLVHYGALCINDETDPTDPDNVDISLLSAIPARRYAKFAKLMIKLTICIVAKDTRGAEVICYNYFHKITLGLISERRFEDIWKMIKNSEGLARFARAMTIGKIQAMDEDLQQCLTWVSTPELVTKAFKSVRSPVILDNLDSVAIERYVRFHEAGIAAQIASGPLKVFCDGEVDPLKVFPIPDDTRVCDLAPIYNPPYDDRTIRQAKIIMDAYGIDYGYWYQGMKASAHEDFSDKVFRRVVSRIRTAEKEAARKKNKAGARGIE